MVNKDEEIIRKYISDGIKRGLSLEQIKVRLKEVGHSEEAIDAVYNKYFVRKVPVTPPVMPAVTWWDRFLANKKLVSISVGILAAIIIIIGLLVFIPLVGEKDCGTDRVCFITAAQNCEPARYEQDLEGMVFRYRTNTNCELIKSIKKFGPEEPAEIVSLFRDKQMVCPYEKNAFNTNWIDTLTFDLDDCKGELKTAILELLLANYELSLESLV